MFQKILRKKKHLVLSQHFFPHLEHLGEEALSQALRGEVVQSVEPR